MNWEEETSGSPKMIFAKTNVRGNKYLLYLVNYGKEWEFRIFKNNTPINGNFFEDYDFINAAKKNDIEETAENIFNDIIKSE